MLFRGLRARKADDVTSVLADVACIILLTGLCTCSGAAWHQSVTELFDGLDQGLVEVGVRVGSELHAVDLVAQLSEVSLFLHQREDYARILSKGYQAYPVFGLQPCVEDLLEYIFDWA